MTGLQKTYVHQSMFWSDLGPEVGYEAIGVCDSQLPTVAVWAKATAQDTPAAAAASAQGDNTLRSDTEEEVSDEKPKKKKKSKKAKKEPVTKELVQDAEKKVDPENYGKGVVFYMREKKVVGILLWNVFHRMPLARRIIADAEDHEDLGELAKKFRLHEE
ncbi:apoptosis-inducing factor 1, mitochondrial-like [Sycon ciliatum]|uniref:apoptosis-inducing factor 1, mitochondrial-like n=1 Tax=Sycon ciliatum TaxID=27933 RepID=UPI0031F640C9